MKKVNSAEEAVARPSSRKPWYASWHDASAPGQTEGDETTFAPRGTY